MLCTDPASSSPPRCHGDRHDDPRGDPRGDRCGAHCGGGAGVGGGLPSWVGGASEGVAPGGGADPSLTQGASAGHWEGGCWWAETHGGGGCGWSPSRLSLYHQCMSLLFHSLCCIWNIKYSYELRHTKKGPKDKVYFTIFWIYIVLRLFSDILSRIAFSGLVKMVYMQQSDLQRISYRNTI